MTIIEFGEQLRDLNEQTVHLLKKRGELIKKIIQDGGNKEEIWETIYKNGVKTRNVLFGDAMNVSVLSEYAEEVRKLLGVKTTQERTL